MRRKHFSVESVKHESIKHDVGNEKECVSSTQFLDLMIKVPEHLFFLKWKNTVSFYIKLLKNHI